MLTRLKTIRAVCCSPAVWAAHLARAESRFAEVSDRVIGGELEHDIFGDQIPRMEIIGDTAFVPIKGVLASGLPSIAAAFGYVDPQDVEEDLDEAMGNDAVKHIVLDCDSPGGMVQGIPELAAKIASIQSGNVKPIDAWVVNGNSALLWSIAGCSRIVALGSGSIGSVGCYTVLQDSTGFLQSIGVKLHRIASGVSKGLGVDGAVSDKLIEETQADVNDIAAEFKAHVKAFRAVADEDMHGQCFSGKAGAARGFCDGTANSLEAAMKLFEK